MEKVKLNIVPKGKKSTCYASQNDNGRVVRFELFNELIPYILDGSETISIKVVRPNSEEILASIENTFEGKAYIDVVFNANMTAIAGVGECEITITDGETVLGSRNFDMNIEIDAYNGRDVIIETSTGTLAEFDTEVEDNALEYESEIPYNADGYTGLRVINTRTAPVYDKTPYLFRKTPSGYGNSCIEKLNGLTVTFNQYVEDGNFTDSSKWNVSPIYGTKTVSNNKLVFNVESSDSNISVTSTVKTMIKQNHVYLETIDITCSKSLKIRFGYAGDTIPPYIWFNDTIAGVKTKSAGMIKAQASSATESTGFYIYLNLVKHNLEAGDVVTLENCMIIDLTQMFGSTIADYIYSLEAAQAGAGVAYFKNLFGADYYAYNADELMSVKTSGRKTVGKNQADFTDGYNIGFDGLPQTYAGRTATVNPIPILQGKTYYPVNISGRGGFIYSIFNGDTLVRRVASHLIGSPIDTSGGDKMYVCAYDGLKAELEPMITIDEIPTVYEDYNAVTYPLDPDLELRGIPKLDANNKLYGDGDIYESSGDVARKYDTLVINGQTTLSYQPNGTRENSSLCYIPIPNKKAGQYNFMATRFTIGDTARPYYMSGRELINGIEFALPADVAQVVADLRNWFSNNPITLLFEKATPTTESADPYTDPQEARVTEEFIDNREIPIPVAQDTIYGTDIEYQDIDFNTTIYGGEIDAVNGVLSSEYNSDGSVKPTPEIIDITPTPIPVKAGDNKIFNNANGNQTIRYYNQVEE